MDLEFNSQRDLYKRVLPALHAKEEELHRLGYPYIGNMDVWNYLAETKWRQGKDLNLSDIVNDILSTDFHDLDCYLKGKLSNEKRTQHFSDKEMI